MTNTTLDTIVSLAKRRGFIFPGSEIYGGLANSWDYGPLGVELKNNIKKLWWQTFVRERMDMVGLDAAILMNPRVWEASGHVGSFTDPLVDCKECKQRFRGDKLLEEKLSVEEVAGIKLEAVSPRLTSEKVPCPACGKVNWTEAKRFNLMFKTKQGVIDGEGADIYLRPETAQGIFVNFKNVSQTQRLKLPFGIAQIGKAFRNEITPGNFTFRTREFEQMEIEYFFDPENTDWKVVYENWKNDTWQFLTKTLGIREENLRFRDHDPDELSHYSKGTVDVEYKFPWGWGELCAAAAYRTDFDLKQHMEFSGEDLRYTDPQDAQRKFVPHVMEPSFGCDRVALAVLLDSYQEEAAQDEEGDVRVMLGLAKRVAPYQIAVLPLSKKDELSGVSREIVQTLAKQFAVTYDETQSIGKRYRRQDEIGTPFCVTVDFDTLNDNAVTVRERDSMKQERIVITELVSYLQKQIVG
jgi:glycyl-tRNA synthetase